MNWLHKQARKNYLEERDECADLTPWKTLHANIWVMLKVAAMLSMLKDPARKYSHMVPPQKKIGTFKALVSCKRSSDDGSQEPKLRYIRRCNRCRTRDSSVHQIFRRQHTTKHCRLWRMLGRGWIPIRNPTRAYTNYMFRGIWHVLTVNHIWQELKKPSYFLSFFPQIALATGVLTSSWGARVRRFCGFVAGEGLSHRVSLKLSSDGCRGQGLQI